MEEETIKMLKSIIKDKEEDIIIIGKIAKQVKKIKNLDFAGNIQRLLISEALRLSENTKELENLLEKENKTEMGGK
jgi:hypothetical protein